jgi:hypothetical protein
MDIILGMKLDVLYTLHQCGILCLMLSAFKRIFYTDIMQTCVTNQTKECSQFYNLMFLVSNYLLKLSQFKL